MTREQLAARVARVAADRQRQGFPAHVEDEATLAKVAALLAEPGPARDDGGPAEPAADPEGATRRPDRSRHGGA
ncbi:MAG TPA: hypothetical protein VEP73_08500 [Actinomycetota bacterium]|nr:hypothetical protein [Actinomycetota bacterium]